MMFPELYYTVCGFVLGFLIMLVIHLYKVDKLKKEKEKEIKPEEPKPTIHVPKYAAGSDIDSIRYHYREPIKKVSKKESKSEAGQYVLLTFLVAFIIIMIVRYF